MNEFYEKAIERLRDDKGLSGNKERAMAPAVREALEKFCEEDGEFAQAVAQGGRASPRSTMWSTCRRGSWTS